MPRLLCSVLLLAAVLWCASALVMAEPDMKLVMVQLLHRHGARAPEVSFNTTEICVATPCGYLSWAGIQMLLNVGAFLRNRYNSDSSVVSEAMFPSVNYDLDVAYSRSTDVLRTLQSAEAFLRGFFPNLTSLYPAIHTTPEQDDYLLFTNYVPQYQFFYNLDKPSVRGVCNPVTDRNFQNLNTLLDIAREVYSEAYCSNYELRSDCARKLFDIAAAYESIGVLGNYPLLNASRNALAQVARALFANQYAYNQSDSRCLQQGSAGQPILQEFVKNIDTTIAKTSKFKLFHYTGHDTTLSRIACSLQDTTDDGLLPPFAPTLVLELLQNASDASYHVRVLRGHPSQEPASNFSFAWEPDWQLHCVDAMGNRYATTANTCPVADFKRFVQWSAAPTGSMGYCYLDEKYQALRNCPASGIQIGDMWQLLPSGCQYYRKRCPSYACDAGYLVDSVSLQCICVAAPCLPSTTTASTTTAAPGGDATRPPSVAGSSVSGGAAAAITMGTFCFGLLVAAIVTALICMCRGRSYTLVIEG